MFIVHQIEEYPDAGSLPAREDLPLATETPTLATWYSADRLSVSPSAPDHDRGGAVLDVRGEIDLGTAPLLREALEPALENGTGSIVVDMSEVTFIDSTGVHLLVDTFRRLSHENRRLAIVCDTGGQVHRVLGLLGLLETLAVYRSRDSALTHSQF